MQEAQGVKRREAIAAATGSDGPLNPQVAVDDGGGKVVDEAADAK